jgi:predicted transcriptional regulator
VDDTTIKQQSDLSELTVDIIAAYVSNNNVQVAELPALIAGVRAALGSLGQPSASGESEVEKPTPAQIRKSITHEGLISFIDGRSYQTLKRHLGKHGLDMQAYRQRYGLPEDYPSTAPAYSEKRSALARSFGLGRKAGAAGPKEAPPEAPKRGDRQKKAAAE